MKVPGTSPEDVPSLLGGRALSRLLVCKRGKPTQLRTEPDMRLRAQHPQGRIVSPFPL